jgi:3-methyladenine DNA glycosylase AlkD
MIIFPDYEITVNKDRSTIFTNIRKLHEGKYYLVPLLMHREHPSPTKLIDYKTSFMNQFIQEAYKIMILWIVNPNLVDTISGLQIEKLDEDQRPEYERVIDNYLHYKKAI